MPGPVIPDPTPAWLKPENASVTDSALTKAMRMIGHLIGADNPTAQVFNLMMTDVPGGSATGGLAKAVEGLKQRALRAYHGSPNFFKDFSLEHAGTTTDTGKLGKALYFSTDPNVAKASKFQYEAAITANNPLHLSMSEWGQDKSKMVTIALGLPADATSEAITQAAKAKGFDSVVLDYSPLGYKHQEIAVFDPTQVSDVKGPNAIKAYHGSPHDYAAERLIQWPTGKQEYIVGHPDLLPDVPQGATVLKDFPLGRQRLEKIGTGEGAQAYGHGLYEAGNEDVARIYRDQLSQGNALTVRLSGGRVLRGEAVDDVGLEAAKYLEYGAKDAGQFKHNTAYYALKRAESQPQVVKDRIKEWADAKIGYEPIKGKMYEVAIKADPEDFLDWDKPLSQQSEKVRQGILNARKKAFGTVEPVRLRDGSYGLTRVQPDGSGILIPGISESTPDTAMQALDKEISQGSGQWVYDTLSRGKTQQRAPEQATEALKQAGIPGIKYLDQGSRAAGEGSRNYVVFDDQLIDILKKYGLVLPAAGLAGSEASKP